MNRVSAQCLKINKVMKKEKGFDTINISVDYTEWGIVRFYIDREHIYHFALYKYDDDKLTEYLSNVFVLNIKRREGLGNNILRLAEEEAISHGSKYLMLKAEKGSWVHSWYNRRGFMDFQDDEDNQEYIWMKKYLG